MVGEAQRVPAPVVSGLAVDQTAGLQARDAANDARASEAEDRGEEHDAFTGNASIGDDRRDGFAGQPELSMQRGILVVGEVARERAHLVRDTEGNAARTVSAPCPAYASA